MTLSASTERCSYQFSMFSIGNEYNGYGNRFNEFGEQCSVSHSGLRSGRAWNIFAFVDASDQHDRERLPK